MCDINELRRYLVLNHKVVRFFHFVSVFVFVCDAALTSFIVDTVHVSLLSLFTTLLLLFPRQTNLQEEEMASWSNKAWSAHLASVLVLVLISAVKASSESTKTVEFNVKPGGVVHTFSEGIVSENC